MELPRDQEGLQMTSPEMTPKADPVPLEVVAEDLYDSESEESRRSPIPCNHENRDRSKVAVILVNYNCGKYVGPFVSSLRKQTLLPDEIVLFDNGSTDGSSDFIAEKYPEVRIINNGKNLGFSVPNNQGIRQTLSEYILVSNLDVVLDRAFIEQMVIPLQRDPSIGWVAGRIQKLTDHGPTKDVDCFAHHMKRNRYATALATNHPDPNDPYYREPGIRWGASACCALYRRRMLDEICFQEEYFDEDFFAYFEDVDLDWRANLYGWKCYYQPSAIAYHAREGSKGLLDPKIMAGLVMNRFFMMIKNDRLQDIARDFVHITQGTLFAFRRMFRECPRAFFYLFPKLALIPRMLRKRRLILSKKKVHIGEIRKWFNPSKRSKYNKEILIFPVGPLHVRLELAKRVQQDHPRSPVTLLLTRGEEEIELLKEARGIGYRLLSKCPMAYLRKSGIVPIYHNAWRRSFLKMAVVAFFSGASPLSVHGESGDFLKKAAPIFLRELNHVILSILFFHLTRMIRNLLPLINRLRHKDSEFTRSDKTWLIIPIYPDLSHHFIYQQVLHLSQLVPSEVVSILRGESKYRADYMEPLDRRIKYLPVPERLCLAVFKGFFFLAFARPKRLLEACLKIEEAAREEGEEIWSLGGFLSPFNPLNGLALYLLAKGEIPKMIHTYGLTIPTNYGLFVSMIFDIPQTATYYIDVPRGIPSRFFQLKKERLRKVIVHTRHCIQEIGELMGTPPENISLIPFGTSLTEALPKSGNNHPVELLTVGRLIPKKGVHDLIEACEILKKKTDYLPCLIVGNGPEFPRLRAAVKKSGLEERVAFLGAKSYDDYLSLLEPHRILVQPSVIAESGDHDGVPTVILDAMARGLIVIGTSVCGIPEVIRNNENGFLVPANDPEALADCIHSILSAPEIRHRISQAARSTMLEQYDVRNLSMKMAAICGFVKPGEGNRL